MDVEMLGCILAGSGVIVGAIYTIFTMKVKKEGISIDNLRKVIDEMQLNHSTYVKEMNEKIGNLEKKIMRMELMNELQERAINKGYRCPYPPKDGICPVTQTLETSCRLVDFGKLNKDKKEQQDV